MVKSLYDWLKRMRVVGVREWWDCYSMVITVDLGSNEGREVYLERMNDYRDRRGRSGPEFISRMHGTFTCLVSHEVV